MNRLIDDKRNSLAYSSHILPFVIWITLMVWIDDSVLSYNIRTFTGILLLLLLKPWSWYEPFKLKNLPISILVGFFVFLIWIIFETPWMISNFPNVNEIYIRLFVDFSNPFSLRDLYEDQSHNLVPFMTIDSGPNKGLHEYNPIVTGWLNFTIHMIGSSLIIPIIEEFFYRSFIYRWMQGSPFYKIKINKIQWPLLIIVSLFFSISHIEWGAAIICGIAFGILYIRTKDIWSAIIAHGITNFLLGLYVLKFNAYQFW